MVFITIMTRGAARFFRFFLKTQAGTSAVKDSLTAPDIKKPRAAILADPCGQFLNCKYLIIYLIANYQLFIIKLSKGGEVPKEQEPAQVLKRFKKEGWTLYTGKGSHVVARKDGVQISVPTSKKEIPIGTYRKIAKTAGWL